MSSTCWTPTWSGRAWTPQPAWRQWREYQRRRWSTGMSRQGPSGCWRTWQRTEPSVPCWPRCWRNSRSSWVRLTLPWAGHWQPSCSRCQPSPTTLRSCCSWRAAGPPARRGPGLPHPRTSASSRGSCGAWGCCGSWPSGLSGPHGTCGSLPSPARAAAQPPAWRRALEGGCGVGGGPAGAEWGCSLPAPVEGCWQQRGIVQGAGWMGGSMSLTPGPPSTSGATPCGTLFLWGN